MAGNGRRKGLRKYRPGKLAQKVLLACPDELETRLPVARLSTSERCAFLGGV